jgi:hypothetical protein
MLINVWEGNILGLVIYIALYIREISSGWRGEEGFCYDTNTATLAQGGCGRQKPKD